MYAFQNLQNEQHCENTFHLQFVCFHFVQVSSFTALFFVCSGHFFADYSAMWSILFLFFFIFLSTIYNTIYRSSSIVNQRFWRAYKTTYAFRCTDELKVNNCTTTLPCCTIKMKHSSRQSRANHTWIYLLAIVNHTVYIMKSDTNIYIFRLPSKRFEFSNKCNIWP